MADKKRPDPRTQDFCLLCGETKYAEFYNCARADCPRPEGTKRYEELSRLSCTEKACVVREGVKTTGKYDITRVEQCAIPGCPMKMVLSSDKPFDSSRFFKTPEEWDAVNKPKHYNSHPSGVQCIEITRHMNFNCGNAVKYIWRADLKADAIEDLEKAKWYLEDEIAKRKGVKRET